VQVVVVDRIEKQRPDSGRIRRQQPIPARWSEHLEMPNPLQHRDHCNMRALCAGDERQSALLTDRTR